MEFIAYNLWIIASNDHNTVITKNKYLLNKAPIQYVNKTIDGGVFNDK